MCIFRWKEYGEITHQQADATSILFVFAESRWAWRLLSGLAMASSISLEVMAYLIHPPQCNEEEKGGASDSSMCQFAKYDPADAVKDEEWCAESTHLKDAKYWFMAICAR